MRRHTIIGEDILNVAPALQPVAVLVRASHERWDGKGYPDGTAGDEIPQGARIVAVCDAFSAMVQDRPYQAGLSVERGRRGDQALRRARTSTRPWSRRSPPRSAPKRCPREARPARSRSSPSPVSPRRPAAALAAPGDIAVADEGSWFGGTGQRHARDARPAPPSCWPADAPLRDPWAVAVAGDGALLVADEGAEAVFRVTPAGAVSTIVKGRGSTTRSGSRSRPAATAYLSDRNRDAVLRLDLATGAHDQGRRRARRRRPRVRQGRQAAGRPTSARCAASTRAPAPSRPPRRARRSIDPRDVAVALDGTMFVVGDRQVVRDQPATAPRRCSPPARRSTTRARSTSSPTATSWWPTAARRPVIHVDRDTGAKSIVASGGRSAPADRHRLGRRRRRRRRAAAATAIRTARPRPRRHRLRPATARAARAGTGGRLGRDPGTRARERSAAPPSRSPTATRRHAAARRHAGHLRHHAASTSSRPASWASPRLSSTRFRAARRGRAFVSLSIGTRINYGAHRGRAGPIIVQKCRTLSRICRRRLARQSRHRTGTRCRKYVSRQGPLRRGERRRGRLRALPRPAQGQARSSPARYRFVIRARDGAGNVSKPQRPTFRIVR